MHEILLQYHRVHPATWAYLSSLLTIALYFKFSRVWSVRNLDLMGLILLTPGLLMVEYGVAQGEPSLEQAGYVWLFGAMGVFLLRLLIDPMMVRRPLLEPNLSVGGLTFLGTSLLLFLMVNVVTSTLTEDDLAGSRMAEQLREGHSVPVAENSFSRHGPGHPLVFLLPHVSTRMLAGADEAESDETLAQREESRVTLYMATARTVAILSHVAVVLGMVFIGYRHFDNIKTGIAAATLYLLLPYTAQQTGRVDHVLPAALLVWSVASYRRPVVAGVLMGLAIGVIYYPAFLLPLWIAFYWQRGLWRFIGGVASMIALAVVSLARTSVDFASFIAQVQQMFGWRVPVSDPGGFWQFEGIDPVYRFPVLAAFAALCVSLAIWPAQKNLGTLMSCSAAVTLATQFWHAHGGGLYMAWFLPLTLLTVFRPNLEDRVALSVLGEGWLPRRRAHLAQVDQAA